jgi:hypothetical protein
MSEFTAFRSKNRDFVHVENGWCGRLVTDTKSSTQVWRLFYGVLRPGSLYPHYVNAFRDEGNYVQFDDFDGLVRWVRARR